MAKGKSFIEAMEKLTALKDGWSLLADVNHIAFIETVTAEIEAMGQLVKHLPTCWQRDEEGALVRDVRMVPGMKVWVIEKCSQTDDRYQEQHGIQSGRWLPRQIEIGACYMDLGAPGEIWARRAAERYFETECYYTERACLDAIEIRRTG